MSCGCGRGCGCGLTAGVVKWSEFLKDKVGQESQLLQLDGHELTMSWVCVCVLLAVVAHCLPQSLVYAAVAAHSHVQQSRAHTAVVAHSYLQQSLAHTAVVVHNT